jgi:predicted ArsR family transcriptional regulator
MARRTFDVIDICEILVHWHAGRSKNEIAGSLGLSRNTVRKYVAAAEAAGLFRAVRREAAGVAGAGTVALRHPCAWSGHDHSNTRLLTW